METTKGHFIQHHMDILLVYCVLVKATLALLKRDTPAPPLSIILTRKETQTMHFSGGILVKLTDLQCLVKESQNLSDCYM